MSLAGKQLVMLPSATFQRDFNVEAFVRTFIEEDGFGGFHRPMQGLMPSGSDLEMAELADEMGFWLALWEYGDAQSGTAPEDSLGFHADEQFRFFDAIADFRNLSVGLGYDCGEWANDNEGTRWVRRLHERYPGRLLAVRVRPDELRRDPDDINNTVLGYRPGQVASFELQVLAKAPQAIADGIAMLRAAVRDCHITGTPAASRALLNAERFRVRGQDRAKDFTLPQVVTGLRIYNGLCAAIWGYGPNVSDEGSLPWPEPYRSQIREVLKGGVVLPPSEPESLLESVRRERAKYPTPMSPAQMGQLLNAVAWPHPGWGLAGKSAGAHTVQPHTGIPISRDLLFHQPSGKVFDVLRDVEGAAEPVWQDQGVETVLPWVAPVDPRGGPPPPPPPPDPIEETDMTYSLNDHFFARIEVTPEESRAGDEKQIAVEGDGEVVLQFCDFWIGMWPDMLNECGVDAYINGRKLAGHDVHKHGKFSEPSGKQDKYVSFGYGGYPGSKARYALGVQKCPAVSLPFTLTLRWSQHPNGRARGTHLACELFGYRR